MSRANGRLFLVTVPRGARVPPTGGQAERERGRAVSLVGGRASVSEPAVPPTGGQAERKRGRGGCRP